MENNNVTKQEVLKFSAEMEEEASIKLAIAKVCDVNVTDIRIVMGGRDTIVTTQHPYRKLLVNKA